jgi:hypothetical protein
MRFGGRPKEVEQRSYRVAKQLQPGLPPKLIHTALHTGTQPAMVGPDFVPFPRSSLRSTHYGRTRGNAPPNPADDHIMCTFNWNSLLGSREGRLLPHPPTYLIANTAPAPQPACRALWALGIIRGAWWPAHGICACE